MIGELRQEKILVLGIYPQCTDLKSKLRKVLQKDIKINNKWFTQVPGTLCMYLKNREVPNIIDLCLQTAQ